MEDSKEPKMSCLYSQDNVLVYMAGQHQQDCAMYNGRITICCIQPGNAIVLDWCPAHEDIEKFDSSDWVEFPSPPAVEFVNNSADMVEIKPQPRKKLQKSFEIFDIKSYRLSEEEDLKLTFYLKDGSSPLSFFFPNKDHDALICAIQKHVKFYQSKQDQSLFIVNDIKKEALEKSFSELQLFDNKKDIVSKFFNDPYTVAMGGFAKVSNGLCNLLLHPHNSSKTYPDSEMAEFLNDSLPHSSFDSNHIDDFEVIPRDLPSRPEVKRSEPLTHEQWNLYVDQKNGKIRHVRQLKNKIFHGGIMPSLRAEVWKYLLGYYEYKSTPKDREEHRKKKMDDYYRMKLQWKSFSEEQESRFSSFRDKKSLIKKDVDRTDREHPMFSGPNSQPLAMMNDILMTYCMYNFDLGYVQGMSDLLSPLLVVIKNEPDVFWCFSGFIDKVGTNFEMDQEGMKTQLEQLYTLIHFWDPDFCEYLEEHESGNMYFFFRWVLILFKRELKFEDVMKVWEVLWTELPCKNFHLILCLAIIEPEKTTIMENGFGLCEILKHVNDMAFKINIDESLSRAEGIFCQIKECDHTPEAVRSILGLQEVKQEEKSVKSASSSVSTSIKSEKPVSPTGAVQAIASQDVRSTDLSRKQDSSPKSSSSVDTSSIEVLSDDVDLESRYEISFGLLM